MGFPQNPIHYEQRPESLGYASKPPTPSLELIIGENRAGKRRKVS